MKAETQAKVWFQPRVRRLIVTIPALAGHPLDGRECERYEAAMTLLVRIILPVSLLIFGLDRLSKIWIVDWLDLANVHVMDVYPPFLNFRMAWNTGINFGFLGGGGAQAQWILIGLSVVISAALLWWVLRRNERTLALGAGAVIGGALGNAWDRWEYGAVADFLNMSCCGFDNPFSFNIADIAIFAGAVWIAFRA